MTSFPGNSSSIASRLTRGIGAIAIGTTLLTGCSFNASVGGASINQKSVEDGISNGLVEEAGFPPDSMDCSGIEDMDVEVGNTHICEGSLNGETFQVRVTLTDEDGAFRFLVLES